MADEKAAPSVYKTAENSVADLALYSVVQWAVMRAGQRESSKAGMMVELKAATKGDSMADGSAALRVEQKGLTWVGCSAAEREGWKAVGMDASMAAT